MTLEDLAADCWRLLAAAPGDRGSPLRTPVLATGGAQARTVVLRAADAAARTLTIFTDLRSSKAAQLAGDPGACMVFYDPASGVQLRAWGAAALHSGDAVARACWDAAPAVTRRPYLSAPGPGLPLDRPGSGLPDLADDLEPGYAHFLVVRVTVSRLEWLRLEPTGNLSARFDWPDGGKFSATWIVP
ncbi:pyridoxamine 5'-phosphate oxidase family protein [Emcibacter sp. SYSU 3D8]|uniref:pyridoxamine 5'-phosphate oxidase family protein n=1 Tax=Emcibacter sp. SYSU 3D8 TaxID=3133969 RepID=UPI0031FF2BDD